MYISMGQMINLPTPENIKYDGKPTSLCDNINDFITTIYILWI